MKIVLRTISHPSLNNREITLLFIDNKIDIPSTCFLINEARYGGRYENISGETSHRGRAIKIRELYYALNDKGKTWRNAEEYDIKMIRNFMLCWDANDVEDYDYYEQDPISNDAMNQKLGVWFKFYKFMNEIGESFRMVLSTKKVTITLPDRVLDHVSKTNAVPRKKDVEVWSLRVKSSPQRLTYHALSRDEYIVLRRHLEEQDPVFGMIAHLMVTTGLRVRAALNVKINSFRSYLKYLNSGLKMNETVNMQYINKGGEIMICDLPIMTIEHIQYHYLACLHGERIVEHDKNSEKGKFSYDDNSMWLLKNGRKVNYDDIRKAFRKASIAMGRKENSITTHWLRHTFATWTLMDYAENNDLPLENTNLTPSSIFIAILAEKLGHASILSTYRYIATALRLMGVGTQRDPIVPYRVLTQNKQIQDFIIEKAKNEFGESFDPRRFNMFKYALSRKYTVKDD